MSRRITIVMDTDLDRKIRDRQSKKIKNSVKSISYSQIVNELVRVGFHHV